MTGRWWLDILVGIVAALLVCWGLLIIALVHGQKRVSVRDAVRLLPDLLKLLGRLARSSSVPMSVRLQIWLLLAYLALPIDLVPDFIPLLGYADDVIIAVVVLRNVVRRTGLDELRTYWPGTTQGFDALAGAAALGAIGGARPPAAAESEHRDRDRGGDTS